MGHVKPRIPSLFLALVLMVSTWPMAAQATSMIFPPCSDPGAFKGLLGPLDDFWSGRQTPAVQEAQRLADRMDRAERGPLPVGLVPGDLGLLRNPCPSPLLSLTVQGVLPREAGRTEGGLASTLQVAAGSVWPGLAVFGSLTWLPYLSEGGSPRLGPASAGFGYSFALDGLQEKLLLNPFVRVHLPPTFVSSDALRLGVEPGVTWRFAPDDSTFVFHAGTTLPWLNAATREGTSRGFHLAPSAGVTWRTPGWQVFTWEAGARFNVDALEQVTLGGAWRTPDVSDWLRVELDAMAAVAGRRRGSFMLGVRLGTLCSGRCARDA